MSRRIIAVAAIVLVGAAAAAGYHWLVSAHVPAAARDFAVVATPSGITLQPVGKGRGAKGFAYADAKGLVLYTYDKDAAGQSACTGECAKTWLPLAPVSGAEPSGAWSIVQRKDGGGQWAHQGKPLYRFAKDEAIGEAKGDGVDQAWHVAAFHPVADIALPNGFAIQDVPDAGGQALVDARGMTLYVADGEITNGAVQCGAQPCLDRMVPVATAQLANPIGEWTVISRDDGIQQWAFRGRPLYSYAGDLQAGDANGAVADKNWHVAQLVRYPVRPFRQIRHVAGHGALLATTDGMTLYRRDRYLFGGPNRGNHPDTLGMSPIIGWAIGTKGCDDAECQAAWHPFKAPADAVPSGFWDIATRADGTRQWVYQGYALYTFAGDKQPGDVNGNGLYDILVKDDPQNKVDDFGTSEPHAPDFGANMPTLFWAYAFP